jgi:hypothetical protein
MKVKRSSEPRYTPGLKLAGPKTTSLSKEACGAVLDEIDRAVRDAVETATKTAPQAFGRMNRGLSRAPIQNRR